MPQSCSVQHGGSWRILSQLHPLAIKQKHYIHPIFEVTLAKNQAAQRLSSSLNFISVTYFFFFFFMDLCLQQKNKWALGLRVTGWVKEVKKCWEK